MRVVDMAAAYQEEQVRVNQAIPSKCKSQRLPAARIGIGCQCVITVGYAAKSRVKLPSLKEYENKFHNAFPAKAQGPF